MDGQVVPLGLGTPEEEDFPGRLLHQAALWDNAELLEDLLNGEHLGHIDSQDSWGRTPLHAAATTEGSRCLRILLQAGADSNIPCGPRGERRTPLHISSEHGHIRNVQLLLEHGANLLAKDTNGMTALDLAEKGEHMECMDVLKAAAGAKEETRRGLFLALQEACTRGDLAQVKQILANIDSDAPMVVNLAPNANNTLLFRACESGQREIVRILLDYGADGRCHPVTKYSPVYIACYYGRKEIAEMVLKKFPELIQLCTVEKWLPLHACCINGHVGVLELLLHKFQYPESVMKKFRDKSNAWEYEMPFDLNMRDVTGQSVLYLACYVGNQRMVELLLKYKVKAVKVKEKCEVEAIKMGDEEEGKKGENNPSPKKRGISSGIQSIMSKLNLSRSGHDLLHHQMNLKSNETLLNPIDLDLYCNNNSETALHVAAKHRNHSIVSALLTAGASPNLPIYLPEDEQSSEQEQEFVFTGSTALVEAVRNRDMGMIDLLLKNGSRDDECKALYVAAHARDEIIMSKLLALKAHQDPEHRTNKKGVSEMHSGQVGGLVGSVTYSSMLPSVPVMINWHGQQCLDHIRQQWLIDASLGLNPKLRLCPRNQPLALHAITRLDVSNNTLMQVPICVFQLQSLRYLNLAQNKLERLPWGHLPTPATTHLPRRPVHRLSQPEEPPVYNCPVLEELLLQDNRFDTVPDVLFQLPSLVVLDLSNNKLQTLPYKMWTSPRLRELNVALNLLRELPSCPEEHTAAGGDSADRVEGRGIGKGQIKVLESPSSDQGNETLEQPPEEEEGVLEESLDDASALRKQYMKAECVVSRDLPHHNIWSQSVEVSEQALPSADDCQDHLSQLQALNLAHNKFTSIPAPLACLAVNLSRLNMSYNNLTSMGWITSYPISLKQVDVSHNRVTSWPSLPSLGMLELEQAMTNCYILGEGNKPVGRVVSSTGRKSARSSRPALFNSMCVHRRHLRFDNIRTLIAADNCLMRLQVTIDDDGGSSLYDDDDKDDRDSVCSPIPPGKTRLLFPNLSMLDVSNNELREIPFNISELTNLSVLNISGNPDICELPPQMGLLSRLWNLNTRGCNLQEPLKTMIESKKYKTMDVVGYLKSILEDARPYARMKLMIVGIQGIGKTSLLEQLRQEGTGSFKKKPIEHWAKRMGNKNINLKTAKGTNISTVGVDIGTWVYEKKSRNHAGHGPVVFRTWDFGGQREYYATHQYFLSRRSLYLVIWRITDGEKGLNELLQWLVNIQARAPNSPVLIVGTHYDVANESSLYPPSFMDDLQQMIRDKFINVVDAEKCGLPRILDTVEVSCKTHHNIKMLCNLIYDTVFNLRSSGSKERLLEQKIPATYLALEDVVTSLAAERRLHNYDPVLTTEQYRMLVTHEMQLRYHITFRDTAELNQATTFLHENGVLLHYDDATLKDLYFLDPQWLCDMLAHVVTIREINPFARNGIMKLDDMKHVFKSSTCAPCDAKTYLVNLLNKFEVALTWDSRTLLIPSLLPTEEHLLSGLPGTEVRIPVRSRGWALRTKKFAASHASTLVGNSSFYMQMSEDRKPKKPLNSPVLCLDLIGSPRKEQPEFPNQKPVSPYEISHRSDPECSLHRLLLMSYFPSGFWSRLLTRMLADDTVVEIIRSYFILPKEVTQDPLLAQVLDRKAEWLCWQTGMELRCIDTVLFRMKEVSPRLRNAPYDFRQMKFMLKQEGVWAEVDLSHASILEILLPVDTVAVKRPIIDESDCDGDNSKPIGYQTVVLDPNPECVAKLLSLAVDQIDTLLEDWYPTLGTRFVHTSEGKYLVTRMVPCPRCLVLQLQQDTPSAGYNDWVMPDASGMMDQPIMHSRVSQDSYRRNRGSRESYTSDGDSGVGAESPTSSCKASSVESRPEAEHRHSGSLERDGIGQSVDGEELVYAWMIEECILAAYDTKTVQCPVHRDISLAQVAPDTIFLDLGERYLIPPEQVKRGKMLGRGAFGFVFKASCRPRASPGFVDVAMKMLQPVDPGPNTRQSAVLAYKAAQSKWERDPLQHACKAYCTARQELNILVALRHPNIVPFIGVCTRPLALVLRLAPQGALDVILRHYRRSGAQLGVYVLQQIVLQVAKAVEYLHQQHIIYRDLKSENVLVWEIPPPFHRDPLARVEVRLADYGISRSTLPTGTKGFGGTEGFMAPEIMRYNGEEEYTEKVDCFSFGMFMYELLSLHQPFEGHDSVKEFILEGGRPPLTHSPNCVRYSSRETLYPTYALDLMVSCWCQQPRERPSASQIVSIASAPEFSHLLDVVSLSHQANVLAACSLQLAPSPQAESELWLCCSSLQLDLLSCSESGWNDCHSLQRLQAVPTVIAVVRDSVWVGDARGQVHSFSASTYAHVFSYTMEPDGVEASPVRALLYLPTLGRVAVGLHNGRLFLCSSDVMPPSTTKGEGIFVLTELGNSTVLHCITALAYEEGRFCELWCGQSDGSISIFSLRENVVVSQEIVSHYDPVIENLEVLQLTSSDVAGVSVEERSVWSYVYPGCVVYRWDPLSKSILCKLDCSKLVPCSESLKSISIEEHLSPGRCQVTSLAVVNKEVYIGTMWGCLVVAEGSTMRPITVFRPYEEEVRAIVPIVFPAPERTEQSQEGTESQQKSADEPAVDRSIAPAALLATVGKGYRHLIARYATAPGSPTCSTPMREDHMYALLWKAEHWSSA